MLTFYGYPQCGTCRKAQKWLKDHGQEVEFIHIVNSPPGSSELKQLIERSGLPIKKFFNTSGQRYRELGLKDRIKDASDEELVDLLTSDGKLLKRPIVTDHHHVTVGFNEDLFEKTWVS